MLAFSDSLDQHVAVFARHADVAVVIHIGNVERRVEPVNLFARGRGEFPAAFR